MEEDPDVLAIARAMIKRFGAEAVAVGEERAEMHRRAQESAGADLWQRVADAARTILSGHSGTFPSARGSGAGATGRFMQ